MLAVAQAEWVLHILLLTDRHPVTHVALGLVAHALYQRLLRRFPYTSLTAPETLASVGAFVLSTYLWATRVRGLHHSMEYTISFLLVTTWLVPLTILMGVAGDTAVLPTSGSSASFGGPYYGAGPSVQTSSAAKAKSKSRSVALRVFDLLRRKRDDLMPTVAGQLPGAFPKQKD
ncbi:hypothetical protein H632_c1284p1 [Helicosporidium sp. ATCC 50920]|nr:hypothetical protein H632_c1284p1 [Helicosporidium sp. ATCC 50920]|eukprot:KDD74480.1 hypothetical protein H632_c1284p1 [Helicosporidium sp. ATCC 50920]